MSTSTSVVEAARISPGTLPRVFSRHLLSLVLPLSTLAFVTSGPHRWYVALLFVLPVVLSVVADARSERELQQPSPSLPALPFHLLLLTLTGLQLVNIGLLARMYSLGSIWSMDTLVTLLLVGVNSGYSGIVVAHELIHRPQRWMRLLGRTLLCTVLYEHFYTEHLRGHHVRVGTASDPATARFGESFHRFYLRTVPAQFRSAWRLETKRLGDTGMKPWDPRLLRSRVVHGIVVEASLVSAILAVFGPSALFAFLLQAWMATRLLETVNYFEHWGLRRRGRSVRATLSWDTDSWFTYYTLVGLSRHADHHAFASRPYPELRHWEQSPKLPTGYFGMVVLAMARNRKFQELMTQELERRRLGPFEEPRTEAH